ncbi:MULTISPECIES: hypothetical protein [Streptomyces]|uniref:Uncharacterized protein n=4 Tax=Streptomyces TaxID=1883 RepID=A0A8H9HHS5_9ACTN|nr:MULTISPECIES: hypothetical protein [Streptomyces]NEE30179.1 hypothetical protein [Streptomyces sp. SID7982]NEE55728.1 hypothetical protein [Streptomyces sp. SID8455]MBL3804517.1 hypothetical protein [Streptomyces sp. BRB081]MDQ0293334.1 hypothetical protein [Streptomyces sp. DSM 41037]NEC15878.1 hypothetical protein [Streptomyces sp. SID8014]
MNITGTIDRPLTHDPKKQAPMKRASARTADSAPAGSATPDTTITGANESRQNRTREMQLIPEAMARAHMDQRIAEADSARPVQRLLAARRMQRRAERASLRARRALAIAVMH